MILLQGHHSPRPRSPASSPDDLSAAMSPCLSSALPSNAAAAASTSTTMKPHNNRTANNKHSLLSLVSTMSILKIFATILIITLCNYSSVSARSAKTKTKDDVYHDDDALRASRSADPLQRMQRPSTNISSEAGKFETGPLTKCHQGWMWFGTKCWVSLQTRKPFAGAAEFCKKRFNATLPTIHSEEENEFLKNNLNLSKSPIWINAKHNHQYNQTYWLDKSPINYTNWDSNQPSDKVSVVCIFSDDGFYLRKTEPVDGQTQCVSLWSDGKWGTQVGCQVLLPMVCEKRLSIPHHSTVPISIVPGGADDTTAYMGTSDPQLSSVSGSTGSIVARLDVFTNCLLAAATMLTLLMQSRRVEQ